MTWLFYVLLGFMILCMIFGARKGLLRMVVSMVFMILVLILASWLSPHIGRFLRENTPIYRSIHEKCEESIVSYMQGEGTDVGEIPVNQQVSILESLPLPQSVKYNLINNNNAEIYKILAVDRFADYAANYVARAITNGIGFLISFILSFTIIKLILMAMDMLTSLPGIGLLNRVGGILLGGIQGLLWIWVLFIVVTVLCNTEFGRMLLQVIENDIVLSFLYEKNIFLQIIMSVMNGN